MEYEVSKFPEHIPNCQLIGWDTQVGQRSAPESGIKETDGSILNRF